jgi:hypothetical protein
MDGRGGGGTAKEKENNNPPGRSVGRKRAVPIVLNIIIIKRNSTPSKQTCVSYVAIFSRAWPQGSYAMLMMV